MQQMLLDKRLQDMVTEYVPQGEILDKSGNAVLVVSIDEVEMEAK